MGYDLRIHIGETSEFNGETGKKDSPVYLSQIAMLELCKPGDEVYTKLQNLKKRGKYCYFYPDGDTRTTEDCYGERLTVVPAKSVLDILKKNNPENYRRFTMAIALLEVMVAEFSDLHVICFGH